MYSFNLYTPSGEWVCTVPGCEWSYDKTINAASPWAASLPRISEMITAQTIAEIAHPGRYAELLKKGSRARVKDDSGRVVMSGIITARDLNHEIIGVDGYTDEILLERYRTPANYGAFYDDFTIGDAVAHSLRSWHVMRVASAEDWSARVVNSSNVDLLTEPGQVLLAKDGAGVYFPQGHITLHFQYSELVDGTDSPLPIMTHYTPPNPIWDRMRWVADSGGEVWTTIQYSTTSATSGFSTEFDGGVPDEIGLTIGSPTAADVWVRINLYSDDQETEDDEGNPVGTTPRIFALEVIGRGGEVVRFDPSFDFSAHSDVLVRGIEANHTRQLDVITQMCEQVGWEFRVVQPGKGYPATLEIAPRLGEDRTNEFTLRSGKNMEINRLNDDDEELCNILVAQGEGDGINRIEVRLIDQESFDEYGPYERVEEFPVTTQAELITAAQEYLDEHANPKPNFECTAVFPYGDEPEYGVGDLVQVVDPKSGIITTSRIETESRAMGPDGVTSTLFLGKLDINMSNYLRTRRFVRPSAPPRPAGLYARGVVGGITVGFSKPRDDWEFTEIYISESDVDLTNYENMAHSGRITSHTFSDLTPGVRYYVTARSYYRQRGAFSMFADVISAIPSSQEVVRSSSIVVAAVDSTERAKRGADIICDGVNDEITFGEALDLIDEGGEIKCMAGTYLFEQGFIVDKSVKIIGEGKGTKFLQPHNLSTSLSIIKIAITAENVELEAIQFSNQLAVDGVFTVSWLGGIGGSVKNCLFNRAILSLNGGSAQVQGNTFYNDVPNLWTVDALTSNNQISGNMFSNVRFGVLLTSDSNQVAENTFERQASMDSSVGIGALQGVVQGNNTIDGNTIINFLTGISFDNGGNSIKNNRVRHYNSKDISVISCLIGGLQAAGSLVSNNDFRDGGNTSNPSSATVSAGAGNRLDNGSWSTSL